jgi:hypothetical protein
LGEKCEKGKEKRGNLKGKGRKRIGRNIRLEG